MGTSAGFFGRQRSVHEILGGGIGKSKQNLSAEVPFKASSDNLFWSVLLLVLRVVYGFHKLWFDSSCLSPPLKGISLICARNSNWGFQQLDLGPNWIVRSDSTD